VAVQIEMVPANVCFMQALYTKRRLLVVGLVNVNFGFLNLTLCLFALDLDEVNRALIHRSLHCRRLLQFVLYLEERGRRD
jgi:hypothetical protein